MLNIGVRQMSRSKALMFKQVLALACSQYPALMGGYVENVARIKKRYRQREKYKNFRQQQLAMV